MRRVAIFLTLSSIPSLHMQASENMAKPSVLTITASDNVFTSYDSASKQFIATWADPKNSYPTFSIYSEKKGWSKPKAIYSGASFQAAGYVFSSYDSATGQIIATWADKRFNNAPTYSIYTPKEGWSRPEAFCETSLSAAYADVFVSYNKVTDQFVATWADRTNSNYPTFSIYTPKEGWSEPEMLSPMSNSQSFANVFTSFDTKTGNCLATWSEFSTNSPTYSIYNLDSGEWSEPKVLNKDSSSLAFNDVVTSFDSSKNQFLATWADPSNNNYPTYSFYKEGSGWSNPELLCKGSCSQAYTNVFTSYSSSKKEFLATWSDYGSNHVPMCSIYTEKGGWSQPDLVNKTSEARAVDDVFTSYDASKSKYLVTWVDKKDSTVAYSSYESPKSSGNTSSLSKLSQLSSGMIEAKLGYFFFTDSTMRKVYNGVGIDGQIAASYPIYKWLHVYGSVEYTEKTGHSLSGHQKTFLWQLPISVGLRPVIAIGEHLSYYATLGPRYFFTYVQNSSSYVPKHMSANGCGGFANTGFFYVFNSGFTLDAFAEYSYKVLKFTSNLAGTQGSSAQVGGVTAGLGFGYAF